MRQPKIKQNKDSKILMTILPFILAGCSIAFVAALYYFGFLGVFSILEIAYESPKHLAIFVGIYLLLSLAGEFFAKACYHILTNKQKTQTFHEYMVAFSLNFIMNWLIISIVNGFYEPVRLAWYTEIVLAAFIALIEATLDHEMKKKK
ncbi:YrvL family regulatory protein [Terribacillus sp. 7520-G]|uniref:YrvL family regulatory protein n=1 Tax=Terribacillus TaxID=459532 RepID=UPI001E2F6D72|nr:YrvL family regulatory protein [Terribacillus sp. 7520-G]